MSKSRIYNNVNCRNRTIDGLASRVTRNLAALASAFLMAILATGAQASDGKLDAQEETRKAGVQIEGMISTGDRAPTLELLQEGFVIECSARIESGCKLFLKSD